ncbi:hypothetical protein BAUCODRAFT_118958 [Baudoinia panamericana UAMH 10762]|uniref:Uncharacterized protein n=1 Tax=Baudoinia panamericana (strain UAMH 10762) TaxID=717646 RepID=M2NQC9_BAUPA|nr:uncharacterized protein BAUCODRAFT_118958 [Baudoinia panamericana UAMH 10762]EMD01251.1 hypothetical protein BAUCODRAFT_118958 [Baudoinia panamericana UAMH 10762]
MSNLYASRWAATPPQDHDSSPQANPDSYAYAEQGASDLKKKSAEDHVPAPSEEVTGGGTIASEHKSSFETADPESKIKKRVHCNGKNVIIHLPNTGLPSLGMPIPLSAQDVAQRLKVFEDAGYDTRGFVLSLDADSEHASYAKPIYPDETELLLQAKQQPPRVHLPDLHKLKADAERLIEERLAALGVGCVTEEAPLPPAPPALDMSRQSSGQYPPLPFSPPIPTSSGMGRPLMARGHSHTMSVASPLSPANGPFGHMHRHSTFSGLSGMSLLQTQQQAPPLQALQPFIPNMQALSPQKPFAVPGLARGGSPAQIAALRQGPDTVRGPGSPLSHQLFMPSPQDYSRSLMDDQRRRQHAYSQSMQFPPVQHIFPPQVPTVQPTPLLPEVPEEDDEGELMQPAPEPPLQGPDAPAYVPPHKRAQFNADVAIPTPTRGHLRNISEGFEREIMEAERRREDERRDWMGVTGEPQQRRQIHMQAGHLHEPREEGSSTQPYAQTYQTSKAPLNGTAPTFNFNAEASLLAASAPFTFGLPPPTSNVLGANGHTRQPSSGTFNAAAPAFQPATAPFVPKTEFNFSAKGLSFKPTAASFEPLKPRSDERTIVDDLPSIFGKVELPQSAEIVKPARRSKAVAIVRPNGSTRTSTESSEELEDEEGRIAPSDDRLKRQRYDGGDGNEVPRFAEPTPMPDAADFALQKSSQLCHDDDQGRGTADVLPSRAQDPLLDDNIAEADGNDVSENAPLENHRHAEGAIPATSGHHQRRSSSLSALAKPFEPPGTLQILKHEPNHDHERYPSVSELEDGEIRESETPIISPVVDAEPGVGLIPALPDPQMPWGVSARERINDVAHPEPSFDEIDAVMRQLNEAEDEMKQVTHGRTATSLQTDSDETPMPGVTYLLAWPRSDAPSPGPRRQQAPQPSQADSSFTVHDRTDSSEQAINGWPHIKRLNKTEEVPASDWSDMLSPPEEEKLYQRSSFFDSHIDSVIGRAIEQRLQPLKESLRNVQASVGKRTRSDDRVSLKHTLSIVDSDADDEDDVLEALRQRPISRGRDKRIDQIKLAVLEALREQSPRRSQSGHDIADLHSALADMKISFARAASTTLELEDVRAVVEEALQRQSQALLPARTHDGEREHRREMSALEGRLNETLAGALEEANHRHAIEEREAETRRLLRLAEEELSLLRDTSRDEDGKLSAMEEERRELFDRVERAQEAQREAEEHARSLEAEGEAMQATLEEYRMSSAKWRQQIDEGERQREELERTITTLERQVEESEEAGSSMRRRLEKLHADMATAAGQLASEKSFWKAREEDYRDRCENFEAQQAASSRERQVLEEELELLREAKADDLNVAEWPRSAQTWSEELVQRLQADLVEQRALAVKYKCDLTNAEEAARGELQRTRLVLESEATQQVTAVRESIEQELHDLRKALHNRETELETIRAEHNDILKEEEAAQREALRKINHANSVALDEARQRHEGSLHELTVKHEVVLRQALEDKQRSEYILNERLALSDAKLLHSHDRISHLEERLEIAKSAAQAAVMSKQARASPLASASTSLPEKVSPQALRESILVLQEQLQERERRLELLQAKVDTEGPAKLKERDTEIAWLRELLSFRSEDLAELVNTLAQPTFDREVVRDTAIRIRANLQMEQQEKERLGVMPQILGGPVLASLSTFAAPKAASLTSAFNKWRSTMESSALKSGSRPAAFTRDTTPSRPSSSSRQRFAYTAGLMTPPASNLRSTPSPQETTSLPPPRLHAGNVEVPFGSPATMKPLVTDETDEPTTPLLREQSYDSDAVDSKAHLRCLNDEDLDLGDRCEASNGV